jgi:hypothetical protein
VKRRSFLRNIAGSRALINKINEGPATQSGPSFVKNKAEETLIADVVIDGG